MLGGSFTSICDLTDRYKAIKDIIMPKGQTLEFYDIVTRGNLTNFISNFVRFDIDYCSDNDLPAPVYDVLGFYNLFESNRNRREGMKQTIRIALNDLVSAKILDKEPYGTFYIFKPTVRYWNSAKVYDIYPHTPFGKAFQYAFDEDRDIKIFRRPIVSEVTNELYAYSKKICDIICINDHRYGEPVQENERRGLWTVLTGNYNDDPTHEPVRVTGTILDDGSLVCIRHNGKEMRAFGDKYAAYLKGELTLGGSEEEE